MLTSLLQLIDLQQVDRLTSWYREFVFLFNPSRNWSCALLNFALPLSLKLSHYKGPCIQSPFPAHPFSAGCICHPSSSPCFSLFLSLLFFPLALWMLIYLWSLTAQPCLCSVFFSFLAFSPLASLLHFFCSWLPGSELLAVSPCHKVMDNLHANGNDRKDWMGWSGGETRRGGGGREKARRQTLLRENMWKRNGLVLLCICVLKYFSGSKTDKERSLNLCDLECLCLPN